MSRPSSAARGLRPPRCGVDVTSRPAGHNHPVAAGEVGLDPDVGERAPRTRTTSPPTLASISTARTPPPRNHRALCDRSRSYELEVADEREDGIGPHLRRQVLELLRGHVRRVADDERPPSRAGRRAAVEAGRPPARTRRARAARRSPARARPPRRDRSVANTDASGRSSLIGERDRARTRARVDDHRGPPSPSAASACSTSSSVSGRGTNTPGRTSSVIRRNPWSPGEVLHRRPRAPLTDRAAEHPGLPRVEPALARVQTRPVGLEHVHQQDLGRRLRALDAVAIQVARRAPQDLGRAHAPRRPSRELFRALGREERVDERVHAPLEHVRQLVHRQLDAVVGHPVLGEVVRADLLGPLAGPDLRAPVGRLLGGRLLLRLLEEPRAQVPHRLLAVLQLRPLLLAPTTIPVGLCVIRTAESVVFTDCPRAGRTEHVDLRGPRAGSRPRPPRPPAGPPRSPSRYGCARGLRHRHALDTVDAGLVLQSRVRVPALDLEHDLLEPAEVRGRCREHLGLPALALRRVRWYISYSVPAHSAASSPPAPARISTTTSLPSFGSLGTRRASRRVRSSAARASAVSASPAGTPPSPGPAPPWRGWSPPRPAGGPLGTPGTARRSRRVRTGPCPACAGDRGPSPTSGDAISPWRRS